MARRILVLPIGGSASRMQGLPKFLLPFNEDSVLIEKHITAALNAQFDDIVVIVRNTFYELTHLFLSKYEAQIKFIKLEKQTKTMCETLIFGLSSLKFSSDDHIVVALADTAFSSAKYQEVYSKASSCNGGPSLILFPTETEQFGKLGQVDIDQHGNVLAMRDKVNGCDFSFFWGIATFPYFMLEKLNLSDAHIGISIQKWLEEGQPVTGITIDSRYFDCGTFSEYKRFMTSDSMYE